MASSDRPGTGLSPLEHPGSERDAARSAIVPDSAQKTEPEPLRDVMSTAQATQHELMRERNRAREALLKLELDAKAVEQRADLNARAQEQRSELGLIGKLFGGRENAPIAVAAIAMLCGIVGFFLCLHYEAYVTNPDRFVRPSDASLAFAAAALAYIFGRGGRH